MPYCPFCGSEASEEDTFCRSCGAMLSGSSLPPQKPKDDGRMTKIIAVAIVAAILFAAVGGGAAPQRVPAGTELVVDLGAVSFHGWRLVHAVVPNSAEGSYAFKGLRLRHSADARQGIAGTLLVDEVSRVEGHPEGSRVTDVTLAGVKVGPVPASDYVVASADTYINGVELLSMSGATIARTAGNYVNVGNIAAGTYLLRVYVAGQVSTHKVVVTH